VADILTDLTDLVHQKLRRTRPTPPSKAVLRQLLELAYLTSLRPEEGRFVTASITFADPIQPDLAPPLLRRAHYPRYTPFGKRFPLTVGSLVKLARGVDRWSASIAVHGSDSSNLYAWGVLDQLVQHNIGMNREGPHGFGIPGVLTISMVGIGELRVYRDTLFLGSVRQGILVRSENDALGSREVLTRISPFLDPIASRITTATYGTLKKTDVARKLFYQWQSSISRLCIGLVRRGTGGAFLITPRPRKALLDITYPLSYARLRDATLLTVLDSTYLIHTRDLRRKNKKSALAEELIVDEQLAETDAEDRENELTGAVKVVASLATLDGVVLLDPRLLVLGFGVKLKSGAVIGRVYEGSSFTRIGSRAAPIDVSAYGTRHGSLLKYCKDDPAAVAVIVSQDGHVRVIVTTGRSLTMWRDVRLLVEESDPTAYLASEARFLSRRAAEWANRKPVLGYTPTPKTLTELMRLKPFL
jgi:hypothetical protein